MRIVRFTCLAAVLGFLNVCLVQESSASVIVASLNFDGSAVNFTGVTNNIDPTSLPAGDMFNAGNRGALQPNGFGLPFSISDDSEVGATGNTSFANDAAGVVGKAKTDTFFGVTDTVNGITPDTGVVDWMWDISSITSIESLSIDFAAMGDFEAVDSFLLEVSVDGSGPITVFSFTADEAFDDFAYTMDLAEGATNPDGFTRTAANPVLLDDPLIETLSGTRIGKADVATGAFTTLLHTFLSPLSGSVLKLTLTATTDGGTEGFALDNIVFMGTTGQVVPEPSTIALMGLGILGAGVFTFRSRRKSA